MPTLLKMEHCHGIHITYKDAGVNIEAGDRLVDRIKPLAATIRTPEMLDGIGGFAGLCRLPTGMKEPVLVSGTDGVGTKLEIAHTLGIHDTVGIDLVAMCVNDIITVGARPLFFLDYFATSQLDVEVAETVIRGITRGCEQAGCALLGGETAEMPGMYAPGTYDLAGFAVGVVDRSKMLDGTLAREGDVVLAVASSGLHSNGYSLARQIVHNVLGGDMNANVSEVGGSIGQALLEPTRIYVRSVRALIEQLGPGKIHGVCHVTGGGLPGNLPRVLPNGLGAMLYPQTYELPALFRWLAAKGPVEEYEMRRTFNLGIGLCVVVDRSEIDNALNILRAAGEQAWHFGFIESVANDIPIEQRVRFNRI
jgi:phosphoribosylformylglycinamidine cyclo-ligase